MSRTDPLARPTGNAGIYSAALCSWPWLLPWCTSASMDTWMEIWANLIELLIRMELFVENLEELLRHTPMPISTTPPLMIFPIDTVSLSVPTSVEEVSLLSHATEHPAPMQWLSILQDLTPLLPQLLTSLVTMQTLWLEECAFLAQLSSLELSVLMCQHSAHTCLKMDWVLSSLILRM